MQRWLFFHRIHSTPSTHACFHPIFWEALRVLDIGGGYPGDRAGFEAPGHPVKQMSSPKKFAARSGFRLGDIFLASHNHGSVKNGFFPTFQMQPFSTEPMDLWEKWDGLSWFCLQDRPEHCREVGTLVSSIGVSRGHGCLEELWSGWSKFSLKFSWLMCFPHGKCGKWAMQDKKMGSSCLLQACHC